MTATRPMLQTYPGQVPFDQDRLIAAIDALLSCSQTCTACADACLGEGMVADLVKCIRTDLDCADVCSSTWRVLTRQTAYDANVSRAVLQACIVVCEACAEECEPHATMHEHCRVCAQECRACERACRDLLAVMS